MAQQTTNTSGRRIQFRVPWAILILLVFLWSNVDLVKSCAYTFRDVLPDNVLGILMGKGGSEAGENNYFQNDTEMMYANMQLVSYDESLLESTSQTYVAACDASSYLITSKGNEYPISNCVDGNINTCWQDGEEGFAEGTVMNFYLGEPRSIRYIRIRPGRADSDEKFYENGRPQYVTIHAGGQSFTVGLEDVNAYQLVEVTGILDIDVVQIVIDTVYEGSKWEDTCMAEVEFYE